MTNKNVFVEGLEHNDNNSLRAAIKEIFLKSTDDLEWLSRGDVVLLKPALNSDNLYPSTTHPFAISVISNILSKEGAGVIVGDQSGLGNVLQDAIGVIHGKTRDNFIKSGMGTDEDNFISFESRGWNKGYMHHQSDNTSSWPDGFYVTKCIEEVDHIINLPRLSAHSQAGVTLGFKNMVGILRDDSRMDFHANGPFNNSMKREAHGSTLNSVDDGSGTFLEKIVEINDAIREKLRVTLFVATKAQATYGPNPSEVKVGKLEIAKANIVNLKPEMVFAGTDPVAVESFAFALMKDIRNNLSHLSKALSTLILSSNKIVNQVDSIPVREQTFIRHAIDIGLGNMPDQIVYKNVPLTLQDRLGKYLEEAYPKS